ncbi:MAG: hypothetical protein AAB384_03470 [Patescibacteria group bacterium]
MWYVLGVLWTSSFGVWFTWVRKLPPGLPRSTQGFFCGAQPLLATGGVTFLEYKAFGLAMCFLLLMVWAWTALTVLIVEEWQARKVLENK